MTLEETLLALLEQVNRLETERQCLEGKIRAVRQQESLDHEASRLLQRQLEDAVLSREELRTAFGLSVDRCHTRLTKPGVAAADRTSPGPSPSDDWEEGVFPFSGF